MGQRGQIVDQKMAKNLCKKAKNRVFGPKVPAF